MVLFAVLPKPLLSSAIVRPRQKFCVWSPQPLHIGGFKIISVHFSSAVPTVPSSKCCRFVSVIEESWVSCTKGRCSEYTFYIDCPPQVSTFDNLEFSENSEFQKIVLIFRHLKTILEGRGAAIWTLSSEDKIWALFILQRSLSSDVCRGWGPRI